DFFLLQHGSDTLGLLSQFRIGLPHLGNQILDQLVKERCGFTQLVAVAQSPADNSAQDVATADIARNNAINNHEATCPDVVGNNLERIIAKVGGAGFTGSGLDQILEKIDFVIGMNVLQYRC